MRKTVKIGIIGDFNPNSNSHVATNEALNHAAHHLSMNLQVDWVPTPSFLEADSEKVLDKFDGLWGSPGGPYRSAEGAFRAFRFARERNRPFVAT